MASLYGLGPADVATDPAGNVIGGRPALLYTAREGGEQYTQTYAVAADGSQGASTGGLVATDAQGRLGFYADTNQDLWADWGDDTRWRVSPANYTDVIASEVADLSSSLTGQVQAASDAAASASADAADALAVANGALSATSKSQDAASLDRYFPEHSGALGDGTTDDSAALADTITRAAAGHGSVWLSPGKTYLVTALINFPAGSRVEGGGTIKLSGAARATGLRFTGPTAMTGITVDFQQVPTSYGLQIQSPAAGSEIVGCSFLNGNGPTVTAVGVKIEAKALIDRCSFSNIATPVQVTGATAGVRISRSTFSDWTMRGIYVLGSATGSASDIRVEFNTLYPPNPLAGDAQPRQPICFQGNDSMLFTDVHVVGNTVTGTGTSHDPSAAQLATNPPTQYGTADLISLHQCRGFEVSNNICTDSGDVGITVAFQCSLGSVTGNVCLRNDSTGICIGSSSSTYTRNISVSGNTCCDNGQNRAADGPGWASNGINLNTCGHITLSGNTCGDDQSTKTQQYGIAISNAVGGIAIGVNDVSQNVIGPYYLTANSGTIQIPTMQAAVSS